jgi:hypothetical protein
MLTMPDKLGLRLNTPPRIFQFPDRPGCPISFAIAAPLDCWVGNAA